MFDECKWLFFSFLCFKQILLFCFFTLLLVAPILLPGTTGRSQDFSSLHPATGIYSHREDHHLLQDTPLFSTSCLEASALSLTINFINGIASDCKQNYLQQNASVHSFKPIYCIDSNCFNYLIKYCIASNQMPHGHLKHSTSIIVFINLAYAPLKWKCHIS